MLVGSIQLGIEPHCILTDQQVIVHMFVLVSSLVHLALASVGKLLFYSETDGCLNHQIIGSFILLSLHYIYIVAGLLSNFGSSSFIVIPIVLQLR